MKKTNLLSSVEKQGQVVTQIITFINGTKKTIRGIITSTIEQSQYTKFNTADGRMVLINDANVLCIEVFKEE